MNWSADYVGIPFRWDGYDRDGCMCWGLVHLVQREVFGRDLPRHDDFCQAVEGGEPAEFRIWQSSISHRRIGVDEAQAGDLLHMWSAHGAQKRPNHIGVLTDPDHVLHIEEGTAALVEDVRSRRVAWRVIGAYRLV